MDKRKLESCIQLIRKLAPSKLEQNINAISNIIYDDDELLNAFLQKIDTPISVCSDDIHGDFLKCEYNRDGDSYRSPLSNKYFPPIEEGKYPMKDLRELEIKLNKMFAIYVKNYYTSQTVCSVYLYEIGTRVEDGFVVVVLIKNVVNLVKGVDDGEWDTTNFITVNYSYNEKNELMANYNLITTLLLQMKFDHKVCGKINLSGNVTKKISQSHTLKRYLDEATHIEQIGTLVEGMENNLRAVMEVIYIKKSQEIIDTARCSPVMGKPNLEQANKLKEMFYSNK